MCSKEERDKRIREMMEKKTRGKEEKMNKIVEKIIVTGNQDAELIKNSYGLQTQISARRLPKERSM